MTRLGAALISLMMWAMPATAQSVSAILEPAKLVEIRSSVAGRIEAIGVIDGAPVKAGDVLAQMDATVQKARVNLSRIVAMSQGSVERADITIAQAQQFHDRVNSAFKKGAAKKWELTQAEQALLLSEADKQVALDQVARNKGQLQLDQATLREFEMRAPFDGTVLQVFAETGAIVETNEVLMEIGDLSALSASAFVPFEWISSIALGDTLQVTLEGGRTLNAKVVAIDPRIDPASLSVRVKLEIPNSDYRLFAGTSITLDQP